MRLISIIALALLTFQAEAATFSVNSSTFKDGQTITAENIFNGFGCQGKNLSPDLEWNDAPVGTQSFAVTIYDPDAPTGSGWWHWTLFNIPAGTQQIKKGASSNRDLLPIGAVEGRTDFGKSGYGGPCPPPGAKPHRYILTVYALKVPKIDLEENAPGAMVGFYLNQNLIAKKEITALYGR